ncbi:hypothetical protein HNP48_000196 [Acidovorax soli]|uniref:Uncharacterized protein n=1 Tax=Acidovorax soli TaxID=592050 RepID=A0A7X0P912_9BURK|nr:hypothetical protein [Acidovorax soli]MBB6557532.1 hypothetical protein [Acidovorax soli]
MTNKRMSGRKAFANKPPVAFENQELALKNIDVKVRFVIDICDCYPTNFSRLKATERARGDVYSGMTKQDFLELATILPSSKRKFNAFTSEELPTSWRHIAPNFRSNAAETLRKDLKRSGEVERIIALVRVLEKGVEEKPKIEKLASLKRQLALAVQLRVIAEHTIYSQKRTIDSLKKEVVAAENRYIALEKETKKIASELKRAIAKQEASGDTTALRGNVVTLWPPKGT